MSQPAFAVSPSEERWFDGALATLPSFHNAQEVRLSPLLPDDFILAKNYIKSFPQHAFRISHEMDGGAGYLLSPTCCYPVFAHLAGHELEGATLFTHKAQCYRREAYIRAGERQSAFLMREYISLSPDIAQVKAWIESVKGEVVDLLQSMGVMAELQAATDPFFNPDDFKQKVQRDENLKTEFVVDGLAVASVNLHLRSFTSNCAITLPDNRPLYSACFGLGYDRLAHSVARVSH